MTQQPTPAVIDEPAQEGQALAQTRPRADLMPSLVGTTKEINDNMACFREFVRSNLVEGEDFMVIPGTSGKPTLLKPGAEKVLTFHGFGIRLWLDEANSIQEFDPERPRLRFVYTGEVFDRRSSQPVVSGLDGECNCWEENFMFSWLFSNEVPAHIDKDQLVERRRKSRKTGKFYSQYRVPKEPHEILGAANTIRKMAQKRAAVNLTLAACRASGFFTQDLEDMPGTGGGKPQPPAKPQPAPAQPEPGGQGDAAGDGNTTTEQHAKVKKWCSDHDMNLAHLNDWCLNHEQFGKAYMVEFGGEWTFNMTKKETERLIAAMEEGAVQTDPNPAS